MSNNMKTGSTNSLKSENAEHQRDDMYFDDKISDV